MAIGAYNVSFGAKGLKAMGSSVNFQRRKLQFWQ